MLNLDYFKTAIAPPWTIKKSSKPKPWQTKSRSSCEYRSEISLSGDASLFIPYPEGSGGMVVWGQRITMTVPTSPDSGGLHQRRVIAVDGYAIDYEMGPGWRSPSRTPWPTITQHNPLHNTTSTIFSNASLQPTSVYQANDDIKNALESRNISANDCQKYPQLSMPHLLCPITNSLMLDPVILGVTGHTFDRTAIEAALNTRRGINPVTNETITVATLAPNFALRGIILDFINQICPNSICRAKV